MQSEHHEDHEEHACQRATTWPNNALASCAMKDKEVEELRHTKDSVHASFDPVEEGACIRGDQRRRDRKVISLLHQRRDWLHQKT